MDLEDVDRDTLIRLFFDESEEGLAAMEEALLALEADPGDLSALRTAFRAAHTLKGNASSLGFADLVEVTHHLEDVLDRLRSGRAVVSRETIDALLASVDVLRARLDEARRQTHSPLRSAEGIAAVPGYAEGPRGRTLRVSLETLDRILDLTGEIAVDRGRLREALESGGPDQGEAAEIHRETDRLHAELQELVMKARMEPVGPMFRRFARTVRDLAASLGKSARLLIEGEDVEVDAKVIEHIRDPLTHLVRNALSHGLETPEERTAHGKDPCGLVRLRAHREAGSIVIEVEDDGAGLSARRIAEKARSLALVAEPEALSEAELQRLIFETGFSTASAVTEVSGRGVGLDVVQRNVQALRGAIGVTSREGAGTTFTIRLPLSLAIIPGFAVRAAGETYILPLEAVLECLELPPGGLSGPAGSGVLSLRGEPLPCRRLRSQLQLPGRPPAREFVVVVEHTGKPLGLVVDALLGESQTVLKPLGPAFRGLPALAGSAILGSGRVALVVDLPGLFRESAA